MENKKLIPALAVSNNPNSILSYGLLMNNLAKTTAHKYQWNVIVEEYISGRPEGYGYYFKWASGRTELERDTKAIPETIREVKPKFLLSIGDVPNFSMTRYFVPATIPWIHWMPIDHHDESQLIRNARIIKGMDVPVCMSKFAFDFCSKTGIKVKHFIYPFVDVDTFKPITDDEQLKKLDVLRERANAVDKHVLLFVGRPGWRKNLEFLFGIFQKLIRERERKDVLLFLHTDPNDPATTLDIGKQIHAFDISENLITMTKKLNYSIGSPEWFLNGIYNIASVYVSPHGGEGFGIPIAEAMACEKPFVLTDCTTTPEFSGDGRRGLGAKIKTNHHDRGVVRPFVDLEDFCDKVEYLLDHENQRKLMGKRGRQWVKKTCSFPIIAKKWLNVFDSVQMQTAELGDLIG